MLALFVGIGLFLLFLVMVIVAILKFKKRKYNIMFIYLLIAGAAIFLVMQQGVKANIVSAIYFSWIRALSTMYLSKYNRYPTSFKDIETNLSPLYHEALRDIRMWGPYNIFARWPKYGIKTYVEDTLVYCILYSYGFDYDDDSLKIVFCEGGRQTLRDEIYIISPIALDGDILIGGAVTSIHDQ
jgi:hypothetical protein